MAPKAMRGVKVLQAMKEVKGGSTMSVAAVNTAIAQKLGLKIQDVKGALEGIMKEAAKHLNSSGKFNLGGFFNMKLRKKPAEPARKGVNPFTKEPCVFKARVASKTVKAFPTKKMKELIN
eukprot:TRINITY_DN6185_c0_g1_i1.p1 TRINITY_DN6185_c0_g1~~TRINITY_DN6185_c0_g1_i1.p1  ORF type:complete len:136 (-),score=31.04 TRINITY_DN6185_c0_g1_i1:103-462(-)